MTFSQFKRLAVEEILQEHLFHITTEQDIDDRFQQLFLLNSSPGDRALLIERLFRKMTELHPSDAYKLLVLLSEAGGIDAIVTTNFDVMLEEAETLLGCDVFQIFAAGVARPYPVNAPLAHSWKKPYLKLHGDLNSRLVSHLTASELLEGSYDPALIEFLSHIIATHDLVFAGYGGFDQALASILADVISKSSNSVFWCSPTPPNEKSPLYNRIAGRCRLVTTAFDDLIDAIAQPVLQKPRYAPKRPTFIRRLFDWRVEHCNHTFFSDYGHRSLTSDLIAHRPLIERTISSFLASDRPLAIVTGPSGFGKTTLGILLYDSWRDHYSRKVILLTSKSLTNPEIEFHLAERLGGLGPSVPLSIASLEVWLREQRLQLVIFVDALNEYSTDLNECARLLRNIVRLCYYLPERNSAVRIVATVRQETWTSILPRLDSGALRQSLWSASEIADTLETIPIGPLTDTELRDAIDRIRSNHKVDIRFDDLSPIAIERLRDPFLLSAIARAGAVSSLNGPTASLYKVVYDAMLSNNGAGVDPATLQDTLARLALQALTSGNDLFRAVDVTPDAIRGTLARAAKDLGILSETPEGYLRFRHDRLHEYFLSLGLALAEAPRLGTLEQLFAYLAATKGNAKARAAARMFFAGGERERFRLIELALLVRHDALTDLCDADREMLFTFGREVIYELTESNPVLAASYIQSGIRAAAEGKVDQAHLRTLVQSAASLPADSAIPALAAVSRANDDLATTEADIYIVGKLLRRFLLDGCPAINVLTSTPYAIYFGDHNAEPWRQLGRILRFLGRASHDNLHSTEYAAMTAAVNPAFYDASQRRWSADDIESFTRYCIANCDRLFFNTTADDLNDFFCNPGREHLEIVLRDLEAGEAIRARHLEILAPYIQSMDFVINPMNVEYNICTLFFIISGMNDLAQTFELWERKFASFNGATPAVEVDFYQGILVCLHTLFAVPYDVRFAEYEERVLRDWPTILKCRPGMARGLKRGFRDEFDMFFEDGFGVIYPYGLLMPTRIRTGMRYRDYQRAFESAGEHPLPLYTKYLRSFLNKGEIDEALQLLQALNEVIVTWPIEGLTTLRDAIGHSDPSVHRAVVRILAEAYNRHPSETVRFLRASGSALSDNDLQEIKIRQDPRIGRRQVSQQEWSRIGYYLLRDRQATRQLLECIRILLISDSFEAAVTRIVKMLGLYTDTRR